MSSNPFKKTPLKKLFNVTEVVTILCYELSPSFSTEGEAHDFWEMLYVDRGQLSVRSGDERFEMCRGELLFHKPNDFHTVECDGERSASIFIISFECRSPAMKSFIGKTFRIDEYETDIIRRLISECSGTFAVSEYPLVRLDNAIVGGSQLIRNYLEELMIYLLRGESADADRPKRAHADGSLAPKIESYLQAHVRGKVSLDEISRRFHYGKSTICDIFKRTYGETVIGYHTKLKIDSAKSLIFEKRMTISEIAEYLGFESPEYFSRTFKNVVGISPRAFRTSLVSGNKVYLENEIVLNK